MGEYDALVEYNECAVRQFISKWEQHKEAKQEYSDFIKEQSENVGIKLGYINIEEYRQDIYRWYLVHPYGCIDNFIKAFKEDLKVFGFNINLSFDSKSAIERLISGLKELGINISIENYKLDVDKYYHRCRNLLAHKLDDKEERKLEKFFCDIQKDKIVECYPTLKDALSAPGVFTFDDYTLCTANLKNITDTLTTDIYENIEWDKFNIESCLFAKKLKRFAQRPDRISNAIKGYLSSEYGITANDDVINILQNKLTQSNNG